MKILKKIMSLATFMTLMMFTSVSASSPNVNMANGNTTQKEVVNEYLNLKNTQKMNQNQLKSRGLNDNEISELKNKNIKEEYGNHIKKMSSYSESKLKEFNYTDAQINAIKHYDGSEEMTTMAASSVSVYNSKSSYSYSGGSTNAIIDYSFSWNGIPFYKFTDAIAICWSEGLYLNKGNTYLNVYYKYGTGSNAGKETHSTISPKPEGAGNVGARFDFPTIIDVNNNCVVSRGSGKAYLFKNGKVDMFGFRASYMHKTLMPGSPSISFPGGVSIGAGTNTSEEDYSLQYYRL